MYARTGSRDKRLFIPHPLTLLMWYGCGEGGTREGDCRATDVPELIPSGGVCHGGVCHGGGDGAGFVRRPTTPAPRFCSSVTRTTPATQ